MLKSLDDLGAVVNEGIREKNKELLEKGKKDIDSPTIKLDNNFPTCNYVKMVKGVSRYTYNKTTRKASKCSDGAFLGNN